MPSCRDANHIKWWWTVGRGLGLWIWFCLIFHSCHFNFQNNFLALWFGQGSIFCYSLYVLKYALIVNYLQSTMSELWNIKHNLIRKSWVSIQWRSSGRIQPNGKEHFQNSQRLVVQNIQQRHQYCSRSPRQLRWPASNLLSHSKRGKFRSCDHLLDNRYIYFYFDLDTVMNT